MERDTRFIFKLWKPPRASPAQSVSVRPREAAEDPVGFMQTLQQSNYKCFEKDTSPKTSMVVPTKPTRHDVPKTTVLPSIEKDELNILQNHCNGQQLYSKLFDEVDKIKCWKVKIDSETLQKERRLQENKRTINAQRKAIQELQFGNESLSIKLEEQISENEDLRNKNNATRNLCNILKDTFQRTAEKMHSFESEREKTQCLIMENTEHIEKIITAFEELRTQAEADRQKMIQVQQGLLEFEDLKEKFEQEYNMKHEEVLILKTKLENKENELQKILLNLLETKESCKQLQKANDQYHELVESSKNEQQSLLEKVQIGEKLYKETEKKIEAITVAQERNKEEYAQIMLEKDSTLEQFNKDKAKQANELMEIQATLNKCENLLTSEKERAKDLELKLTNITTELERTTTVLGETIEQSAEKDEQIQILEDKLDMECKSIDSLTLKNKVVQVRVQELTAELSRKNEEVGHYKGKADNVSAEKDLVEKACLEAKNAHAHLKERAFVTEIKVQEIEGQLLVQIQKNEASTFHMEQLKKDIMQHEVRYEALMSSFNEVQAEKKTILEQIESGSFEAKTLGEKLKVSAEREVQITRDIQRCEENNQKLKEEVISLKTIIQQQCEKMEDLQKNTDESCEDLKDKMVKKEKQIKAVEAKLCNLKTKFETKSKALEECHKENKTLKKQMAKEIEKCLQLENRVNSLDVEYNDVKRQNQEERQKLLEDLCAKSSTAAQLENEVQMLILTASEAAQSREDAELKCQHKIADMVTLMEKHKNQYDRMIEEKDAEIDENKRKEMQEIAQRGSLELERAQSEIENDRLKKQLKQGETEMEHLRKELKKLKKDRSTRPTKQTQTKNEEELEMEFLKTPVGNSTIRAEALSKETYMETIETPSWSLKSNTLRNEEKHFKTPSQSSSIKATPKIKSYRVRTPPSVEKAAPWRKSTLVLEPKSDSSEHNDLLTYAVDPEPSVRSPQHKTKNFETIQCPASHKSPGNLLKHTAIKRMRDAGWTTVTGSSKKKKKNAEKIFA